MTTTFKKGQRVRWEDPNNEHSGEYDVLDPQGELNMGKPENERIIRIGDTETNWDVPADCLTIVCPISDVDRDQLAMQKYRNSIRDKELLEHMQELVGLFEGYSFEAEGNSAPVSDEDHDACSVYGFCVEEGVLYARLEYDDGGERTVPVSDLCVVELFNAFHLLIQYL